MRCSCCQSAWYYTSEHLSQSDWPRHRKECVLGTHIPKFAAPPIAEQQVITGSAVLFSSEEWCPNIITVKCHPSKILSWGTRPQPLVSGHFSDGQAESIVLMQGFNGEPLRFPLHLWYLPNALSPCAPINRATSCHISASNEEDPTIQERRTIAIFQHPYFTDCVTFSRDYKHILNDDIDMMISGRAVSKDTLPEEALNTPASKAQDSGLRACLHVLF
ncbi:hypothetical protein F4604DRAFT_1831665 [Suillus subluteus]|nr:hypothetical protein F4604DRAFT_1831665 [Suillus subluteus]